MKKILFKILKPISKDEDKKRKEYILNVLVMGSLALTIIASFASLAAIVLFDHKEAPDNFPYLIMLLIAVFFAALYYLSRKGFSNIASFILIFIYFVPTLYTSLTWGTEVPQGLLTYALIITMAGVLISTRFAWAITLLISFFLILISYFNAKGIITPDSSWRNAPTKITDIAVFVFSFIIITLVSWLSNREIERSLLRARKSESALKKERDSLEIRVEARTKELKEAQREKMVQLTKFAEFGKLASGIFHDLSNPLTAASLNLEEINRGKKHNLKEVKPYIEKALKATKRVEEFVGSVRKQLQQQDVQETFNIKKEIDEALEVLDYKAQKAEVQLQIEGSDSLKLYGNPLKFLQVMTNLISNAIDSYEKFANPAKQCVLVNFEARNKDIILSVQDWGKGIKTTEVSKIFDPFFTTKNVHHGTGIGLSIVKEVVEEDFSGKIDVESEENKGTTFTIKIPSK